MLAFPLHCMIRETGKPPLGRDRRCHAKERLLTLERGVPFEGPEILFTALPGFDPASSHLRHVLRSIELLADVESRLSKQPGIHVGGGEEKEPDRAADRNLLIREQTGHHDRIREHQVTSGPKNASPVVYDLSSIGEMIDGINADQTVEAAVRER